MPLPEEIERDLAVIDRTLAGAPVDPEFADLAELTLLLADARPAVPAQTATRLDRRISGLATPPADPPARQVWRTIAPRRRPWFLRPAVGAGLAVLVILAVLVVVLPRGGGGASSGASSSSSGSGSSSGAFSPATRSHTGSSSTTSASGTSHDLRSSLPALTTTTGAGDASLAQSTTPSLESLSAPAPTPQSNGRRIVQSSDLDLTAPGARIGTVAQELFDAVGAEQGIVEHSQVVTGSGGSANFTLSIPTANLSAALARLAALRYASVTSSTESSTDVNSQYLDDQRRLADARALRISLLKQLQAASTTAAIDSLRAQIASAESTIAADEGSVNSLQGRISYTSVSVQITPGSADPAGSGGGFGVSKAGHDALDVLKVIAGVLLIALAVLVPLGLVVGVGFGLRSRWRRHGRERALDAA